MTTDNDTMKALERLSQGIANLHNQVFDCQETRDYRLVSTALHKSARVDELVKCANDWSSHLKMHGTCIASDVVSNAIDEAIQQFSEREENPNEK